MFSAPLKLFGSSAHRDCTSVLYISETVAMYIRVCVSCEGQMCACGARALKDIVASHSHTTYAVRGLSCYRNGL